MLLWKHNWHPPLVQMFIYMDYQQMCGSLNMVLVSEQHVHTVEYED